MSTEEWRSWRMPKQRPTFRRWHDGRCAMCGEDGPLVKDHCHSTGLVRGYLCRACNRQEGKPFTDRWDAWQAGDHAAAAFGHFEVYVNLYGQTPLSPYSALVYYSLEEQDEWHAEVEADLNAGGKFPSEAPWSEAANARRSRDLESLKDGSAVLSEWLNGGAA